VAKPSVPGPIVQQAMDYACGSGADCDSIQPSGPCFHPDSMVSHASFAFNSYWQRTKANGATCDFGGTAMLITKEPSKPSPYVFISVAETNNAHCTNGAESSNSFFSSGHVI